MIKQQSLHSAGSRPWTSRMAAGQLCQPTAPWHLCVHQGGQGLESDQPPAVCRFGSINVLSTYQMFMLWLLNQTSWVRALASPLTVGGRKSYLPSLCFSSFPIIWW